MASLICCLRSLGHCCETPQEVWSQSCLCSSCSAPCSWEGDGDWPSQVVQEWSREEGFSLLVLTLSSPSCCLLGAERATGCQFPPRGHLHFSHANQVPGGCQKSPRVTAKSSATPQNPFSCGPGAPVLGQRDGSAEGSAAAQQALDEELWWSPNPLVQTAPGWQFQQDGRWTPELLHKVLCNYSRAKNFPAEHQLLLWREPGIQGSKQEEQQPCRGPRLLWAAVQSRGKGCSAWNWVFFKWWFSKRGTNTAKKPPQPLPALLQRPYLGTADSWPHLQPKN